MAVLFIRRLDADFTVGMPHNVVGDYHLQFGNPLEAKPKSLLIEVKGTVGPVPGKWPVRAQGRFIESAVRTNTKVMLLVADVLNERLYFGWFDDPNRETHDNGLDVPVRPVTDQTIDEVKRRVIGE